MACEFDVIVRQIPYLYHKMHIPIFTGACICLLPSAKASESSRLPGVACPKYVLFFSAVKTVAVFDCSIQLREQVKFYN